MDRPGEHPDHESQHEDVKGQGQFGDERQIGRYGDPGEEGPVLHGQEPQKLGNRFPAVRQRVRTEEESCQPDGHVDTWGTRDGRGPQPRKAEEIGRDRESEGDDKRSGDANDLGDLPPRIDLFFHQAPQEPRQKNDLCDQVDDPDRHEVD